MMRHNNRVKLLQAGKHGGAGICDTYRSRLWLPTAPIFLARKVPQSNTVPKPVRAEHGER